MPTAQETELRREILEATIELFNQCGLRFTMDQLASGIHRSKKTLYVVFPDKQTLLDAMVDYVFDSIKESETELLADPSMNTVEKLKRVLGAMPDRYDKVDLRSLYVLREKYPRIYAHVQRRLESGWEPTIKLMEQGISEGVIRPVSIPIFQTMMSATLEQFFQRDILIEHGIPYSDALQEVVDILLEGIVTCKGEI